jgi:Major tropism determinant N-terminal domain
MGRYSLQTIILRRDPSAIWIKANPILEDGELVIEEDTHKIKMGNGTSCYNDLTYLTEFPIKFKIRPARIY